MIGTPKFREAGDTAVREILYARLAKANLILVSEAEKLQVKLDDWFRQLYDGHVLVVYESGYYKMARDVDVEKYRTNNAVKAVVWTTCIQRSLANLAESVLAEAPPALIKKIMRSKSSLQHVVANFDLFFRRYRNGFYGPKYVTKGAVELSQTLKRRERARALPR